MLSPEEVKPLLVHEDRYIREAAMEYFRDSYSRDPEILPLLLKSHERFGSPTWRRSLIDGYRFSCDEAAFEGVIAALASAKTGEPITFDLGRVLAHASPALLAARRSDWESLKCLRGGTRDDIERRWEIAQWPAEKLWLELRDFATGSESQRYVGKIDHGYADALIAALAQHEIPSGETICDMLRAREGSGTWLEIFLVDLSGERQLKEAIPALVDKYCVDTDYLLERSTVALAKIGDVDAVRLVRSRYGGESVHFRWYSHGVYTAIKHVESEEALLEALGAETDITLRTMLCCDLCKLFSARGVGAVLEAIRNGYDRGFDCLEERVLPVAEVLGIELPEGDAWRAAREERARRRFDRAQELAELGRKYAERERIAAVATAMTNAFRRREVGRYDDGMHDDRVAASADAAPVDAASTDAVCTTIRNTSAKIGRNDPCPCGSGKKFKKCCG